MRMRICRWLRRRIWLCIDSRIIHPISNNRICRIRPVLIKEEKGAECAPFYCIQMGFVIRFYYEENIMLTYNDIIKEDDQKLRERSIDVAIPLTEADLKLLKDMNEYLINGYDKEKADALGIRPGVGLSAVQLGILKKIIVILAFDEKGRKFHYGIINPKIISQSEETVYLSSGEGCLSVDREVAGLVHRSRRIKVRGYLYDFQSKSLNQTVSNLQDYLAIVFQHEYDHLNGILFIDRIDKFNPFFIPENSNPIVFEEEESEE